MEYIKVFLVPMPLRIHGATIYSFDDGQYYYTILINSSLSSDMQCAAYDHEIAHINNGDFEAMTPVAQMEALRHAV